jgi:hypothetical protein
LQVQHRYGGNFRKLQVHINKQNQISYDVIYLRVQEVLEQPGSKNRHGTLREPPLWSPDVVRLAERIGVGSPQKGGAASHEPEVRHLVLAKAIFPSGGLAACVAQLALYPALQILEVLGHGPESDGSEGSGVAQPGDRLK